MCDSHNHHTVVLLESPAIMSKIRLMPGIFNTVPSTGTLRRKFIATGRKPLEQKKVCINLLETTHETCEVYLSTHLNNNTKPYVSRIIPTTGQPISTTKTPPRNETLAFILCLWKKKFKVLHGPITHPSPAINKSWKKFNKLI